MNPLSTLALQSLTAHVNAIPPGELPLSKFPIQYVCALLVSRTHATYTAQLILLNFMILIISNEQKAYKL